MNFVERTIYDVVKRNPAVKRAMRNIYQQLFDFFPAKPARCEYPLTVHGGKFFGFHDHSPFSSDEALILSCLAPDHLAMPRYEQPIGICLDARDEAGPRVPLIESFAWNWHMGCKLQWVDDETFFFNDLHNGKPVGRFCDLSGVLTGEAAAHFSDFSPDGALAVGYPFSRVEKGMPGYGYLWQEKSPSDDVLLPTEGGLYLWDVNRNCCVDRIGLSKIHKISGITDRNEHYHFVTHATFSKDGSNIAFIYRWVNAGNVDLRRSKLITYNLRTGKLTSRTSGFMASHYHWVTDTKLVCYCNVPEVGDCFCIIDTVDDSCSPLDASGLASDGHPTVSADESYFVSDTYPNRRRVQELYMFDLVNSRKTKLGEFVHPRQFQSPSIFEHWCVDLHPRLSDTGQFLSFDACFSGERSHCILDLRDL